MTLQMWTATLAKARTAWEEQSEGHKGPRKNLAQADPALLGDAVQGAAEPSSPRGSSAPWSCATWPPATPTRWPRRCTTSSPPTEESRAGHAAAAAVGGPRHRARAGGGPVTTIAVPAWLPSEPELKVTEASGADPHRRTRCRDGGQRRRRVGPRQRRARRLQRRRRRGGRPRRHDVRHRHRRRGRGPGARRPRHRPVLTQMRQRCTEREELMERRRDAQRRPRVPAGAASRPPPRTRSRACRPRRPQLRSRFEAYHRDLQAWRDRVDDDEQAAARALGAVDQLAEGLAAAKDSVAGRHRRAGCGAAPARDRHRRGQLLVGRALPGRAQRADDQRPRPRRQHQRRPYRRPRRGQHLGRAARHRVPPRSPGVWPGPQRLGAAVARERPVHRARRRQGPDHRSTPTSASTPS